MKKKNTNTILNDLFLSSVDAPLRELVDFLHSRNIKTTPSCSGHNIHERDLGKIYDSLELDCELIKTSGLEFVDIESLRQYFYKDKNYSLPWKKEDFVAKLGVYQHKGVLGIRAGNRMKFKKEVLSLKIDGVTTNECDSILFIFTDQPGENNSRWKEITKTIKEILK